MTGRRQKIEMGLLCPGGGTAHPVRLQKKGGKECMVYIMSKILSRSVMPWDLLSIQRHKVT